jgi:hypothetical protein
VTVYRRNPLLMTVLGANPGPSRRRKNDNAIDAMIGAAWARFMSGVQVSVMEIPKIFRDIKLEMSAGMPLEAAVREVGSRYRVNRNPLGEALLAGATSAVVSHALQSNPHLEGDPCSACGGPLAYQGTLGNREHYRCRNCGRDFSTEVAGQQRRRRSYKKTCGHGYVTRLCKFCRGRRIDPRIKPCPHGISGGGARCVACQRLYRPGGPVQNNPAIQKSWDGLKWRQRMAILEFAGIGEDQASYLSGKSWERIGEVDPRAQAMVMKGWRDSSSPTRSTGTRRRHETTVRMNPKYKVRYLSPSMESREEVLRAHGLKSALKKAHGRAERLPKQFTDPRSSVEVERYQENPGSKRKLTMTIEKFAQWVKAKRDPTMWKAFLAKFRGYEKWTHGAKAKKVTVEWVDTPGVNGLWITYDGGKQPESTYIMPKGVPRKGAWKHPWDTMPDIKHDPEAKIVITKLRGSSKITDFYHK